MNKYLYWIDDDVANILNIARGIFPVLWGLNSPDHIINKIILFGDDQEKGLDSNVLTDKRERNIIHALTDIFVDECNKVEQASPEHSLYENNKNLTNDIFRLFAKIPTEITSEDEKNKQNKIIDLRNRIINYWKNTDTMANDEDYKNNQKDINKLIEEFAIPDDAYVAIDLVLLYKDDERVKEGRKIISMELYNRFSLVKPGRCFIYSRYISDIQLADAWEKVYHKNYDPHAEIKLYKRKDLNMEEPYGVHLINDIRNNILKG